jgi:hypothetical protein
MRTHVINQSASEPRLHRVLYVLNYLRAMLLNVFLVFIAMTLFLGAGIEGIYFLADSAIDNSKARESAVLLSNCNPRSLCCAYYPLRVRFCQN